MVRGLSGKVAAQRHRAALGHGPDRHDPAPIVLPGAQLDNALAGGEKEDQPEADQATAGHGQRQILRNGKRDQSGADQDDSSADHLAALFQGSKRGKGPRGGQGAKSRATQHPAVADLIRAEALCQRGEQGLRGPAAQRYHNADQHEECQFPSTGHVGQSFQKRTQPLALFGKMHRSRDIHAGQRPKHGGVAQGIDEKAGFRGQPAHEKSADGRSHDPCDVEEERIQSHGVHQILAPGQVHDKR